MSHRPLPRFALLFAVLAVLAVGATLRAAPRPLPPALFARLRWRFVGPYRGGWATTVTGIVGRPNTYFIGTADGGVFVTHDGGRTWQALFQHEPVASIGAVAVAPSDPKILYAGTGASGLRSDMSFGDGVYRSNDGGRTWIHVGLDGSQHIAWILVSPHDPNRVLVAVLGHAFGPNRTRGVYLTTNGGRSWKRVLGGGPLGAIDLARAPHHPAVVYAALWNFRFPFYGHYGVVNGPGGGLWVSHDGGMHWTKLPDRGLPRTDLGRIGLAVIPGSDGRGLYAVVGAHRGGVFVTHDGGRNWTRLDSDPRLWAGTWYFGEIFADPQNPRVVYVCNTALYRSTDGGRRFTSIKGSPSGDDFHTMWIDPRNPRRMIVGADQGASISVDDGRTWSSWYNQPTAQIYHVAVDNRFPYRIYGTQQDSGSIVVPSRSHDGFISNRSWFTTAGGEAGYVLPDPRNPDIIYGSSIVGSVTRENLRTHEAVNISPWPVPAYGVPPSKLLYRYPFNTALALSPRDPHVLYVGSEVVFRSADRGESWHVISPVLTGSALRPRPCHGPVTLADATVCGYGVINTIDPSPIRRGEIWVGTTNGRVWLTLDGGHHWRLVTPRGLPRWTRIESISPSPRHPGVAYLAANRHRLDDFRPYVYRTDDDGRHWTKITRGLSAPNYVHVVRVDPRRPGLLFAGTENGIDVSFDRGAVWQSLQLNLPTTSVRDIAFHDRSLVVATHGRGFWVLDDVTLVAKATSAGGAKETQLLVPDRLHRYFTGEPGAFTERGTQYVSRALGTVESSSEGALRRVLLDAGYNPPDGVVIRYRLAQDVEPEQLELAIFDASGDELRRYRGRKPAKLGQIAPTTPDEMDDLQSQVLETAAGLHRHVWNLCASGVTLQNQVLRTMVSSAETGLDGPRVPPGKYRLELRLGDQVQSADIEVLKDPNLPLSDSDYEQQYRLLIQVRDHQRDLNLALKSCRQLRDTLGAWQKRADIDEELQAKVEDLSKELTRMESTFTQPGWRGEMDEMEMAAGLDGRLFTLQQTLDRSDAAPTKQAKEMAEVLFGQSEAAVAELDLIVKDQLASLNAAITKAALPPIPQVA